MFTLGGNCPKKDISKYCKTNFLMHISIAVIVSSSGVEYLVYSGTLLHYMKCDTWDLAF